MSGFDQFSRDVTPLFPLKCGISHVWKDADTLHCLCGEETNPLLGLMRLHDGEA